ncbi:hypothetical protein TWF718_006584 [Orbilia javanica]|uniref:Uncharacterized protein n=1 Tax=Orbilia javanica TaxID=47235 RepID=A0AAN8N5L1_9PEZI
MPPKKRVSTKDLAPATTNSPTQPIQSVPDPQASIASLAEAFPTSFSSRFQEGQLAGPSSTIAVSSPSPAPLNMKQNEDNGKGKTTGSPDSDIHILGQASGNKAGNPTMIPDNEGEIPNTGNSTLGVADGGSAASPTHESPSAAGNSVQGNSGAMSQAQLDYLQNKYDEEAQELRATEGNMAVRESGNPFSAATPAPEPFRHGHDPMLTTVVPTGDWDMDASRLANFQQPDLTADLVARVAHPYIGEGILEEDQLRLGDLQSSTTTTNTAPPSSPVGPKISNPTNTDEPLPSAGFIDWDDEFKKMFRLVKDGNEEAVEDPTEEEWEKIIAEAMRKGKDELAGLEAEVSAVSSPMDINDVMGEEDEQALAEEPAGLPYPALDAEAPTYDPTDLTMWVYRLSLDHPENPEEMSLEELGRELDAYWGDVEEISSQPVRTRPLPHLPATQEEAGEGNDYGITPADDQLAASPTPRSPEEGRRGKRGAQAGPDGPTAPPRTRLRTSQGQGSQRRRSARISGAGLAAESQPSRDSSPPLSVTSEGRRGPRTSTGFMGRCS